MLVRLLFLLLILLPSLALAAPLQVVATLPSLGAIAREVGGPLVQVEALASPRQDPHYVDARPSMILSLSKADLLVINGLELEIGWLPGLLRQSRNPKVQPGGAGHLDASTAVERLQVPAGPVDRSHGDIHPGGNPHYLYDPRQGARVALAVGVALGRLDPPNQATYQKNAQALAARLNALAAEQAQKLAQLPVGKRQVAVYHDSLPYLLRWLGIKQVATLEPRPGIPPSPSHVAQVLQVLRSTGARVLVQEEFYPRNTAQTLASMAKGTVVTLPGGTRLADGQGYVDHVRSLAQGLYDALAR